MGKRLLILFALLVLCCQIRGTLIEKTSLNTFKEAGMPVKEFQKAEILAEEMELYLDFWKDLAWFPVAKPFDGKDDDFFFENTWHEERSYGGERQHEGCDIFGSRSVSGYYPVISITDGEIEQIGWLPLGGYRVGVRSPGGGYFYYAHLSSYGTEFQIGDEIKAGEILGFLGDSGYGEEGTTGMFPPHLHLGIYVKTDKEEEHALNPYPVLQFLRERQKNFFY